MIPQDDVSDDDGDQRMERELVAVVVRLRRRPSSSLVQLNWLFTQQIFRVNEEDKVVRESERESEKGRCKICRLNQGKREDGLFSLT